MTMYVHTRYSGLYTVEITTAVPGGYTNKRVRVSTNLRVHASFMFAGFKQGTAASAKLLVECTVSVSLGLCVRGFQGEVEPAVKSFDHLSSSGKRKSLVKLSEIAKVSNYRAGRCCVKQNNMGTNVITTADVRRLGWTSLIFSDFQNVLDW